MFKNYFVTAHRNLLRNQLYSAINIGGLALALAASILAALVILDELTFDTWVPDNDRIVRIETTARISSGVDLPLALTAAPLTDFMTSSFPNEIEAITRLYPETLAVEVGDFSDKERVIAADPEFPAIFPWPVTAGDLNAALADTTSVAISEAMAAKYFSDPAPIGKTLTIMFRGQATDMRVAAVLGQPSSSSHLGRIDFLTRFDEGRYTTPPFIAAVWGSIAAYTYAKLATSDAMEAALPRIPDLLDSKVPPPANMPAGFEFTPSKYWEINVTPLRDLRLLSQKFGEIGVTGTLFRVLALGGAVLLLLVIAGSNFVNLSTATAVYRTREIGLRKALGATRPMLVRQLLLEAIALGLVAMVLAIMVVEAALPSLNAFLGRDLVFSVLSDPLLIAALVAGVVLVGLMSGLYPALYASSLDAAKALHSSGLEAHGRHALRQGLIALQFSIAIGLVSTMIIMHQQNSFADAFDYGFELTDKIVIDGMDEQTAQARLGTLRDRLTALPEVAAVGYAQDVPPLADQNYGSFQLANMSGQERINIEYLAVNETFFDAMNIKPLAGRVFGPAFPGDRIIEPAGKQPLPENRDYRANIVVSESAAKTLGFDSPDAAVGQSIRMLIGRVPDWVSATIVGVAPDIYVRAVDTVSEPVFYAVRMPYWYRHMIVRRAPSVSTGDVIAAVEKVWGETLPDLPFAYSLMDETYAGKQDTARQQSALYTYISIFALTVAALGLFGLTSFLTRQRRKEIGIRRVLGAGVFDIVRLLVFQFSKPVLLANLIAWPVAWYFMRDWLEGFAYRIDLNPGYFLAAGVIALMIAWLTVAGHSIHVARANPIRALRYE